MNDPISVEILWTRLISIVDEAAKAIGRTAFSTIAIEANDFACVLTDRTGNSIAQNTTAIPAFIGSLPATVRHFVQRFGLEGMHEGDVFITNNPWLGTGHLNDVSIVKPIFVDGRIAAFAAGATHLPDIGGHIRSVAPQELFEEGFHIPLMRLRQRGEPNETLLELLRAAVRTPTETVGDIWALSGALDLMEARVLDVLAAYGVNDLDVLSADLLARSERAMRNALGAVPEGEYHYTMQTDGLAERFVLKLKATIRGGGITLDFTGSSPQQPRAINCPFPYTYAMAAFAVKAVFLPEPPNNEGMFRPIEVLIPEGSILNPTYPVSVGGRAATGHYVPAVVFGALHEAVPGRVPAASGSPTSVINFSGRRADSSIFATSVYFNGGMGARPGKDGVNCLSWPSNIASTSVEVLERGMPFLVRHKKLSSGSGGEGKFRGGLGQEILIESRADNVTAIFLTERTKVPAPGLAGGEPGGLSEVRINAQAIDTRLVHKLQQGDTVLLKTAGGGGYGPAKARPEALAERDAILGYAGARAWRV